MASPHSPGNSRPRLRRVGAALVDAGIGAGLAFALSQTAGMYFARRAVVMLHIGEPGTWWQGPVPLMLGVVGEVTYLLPCAIWLAWLIEPLTGATIGKRLTGVRVRSIDGTAPTYARLWRRHLIQMSGLWGLSLALVTGLWQAALLAAAAAGVMGIGWLGALGRSGRSLHDRLSGTRVS